MTLEQFHASNPNITNIIKAALKSAAEQIGGIDGLKKLDWFCSNADKHIAEEAEQNIRRCGFDKAA